MVSYRISPYLSFIENRLFPGIVQYAVCHRLSGTILEPDETVRSRLLAGQFSHSVSLSEEDLNGAGRDVVQFRELIDREFLISEGYDPLSTFQNHYVARPIQNPALTYHSSSGEVVLVRTSMAFQVFSPRRNELPEVIEEPLSPAAAKIFELADGTKTLQEIFNALRQENGQLDESEFVEAVMFLTTQERQLIKVTTNPEDLFDPFKPVNTVPRNLYHADRWVSESQDSAPDAILDFHRDGIEEASWEFDLIEPTVNHAFRFPNESFGGVNYGSRFCTAILRPALVSALGGTDRLEVLEVGGGTGTFARAFLGQAQQAQIDLNYHILDLSPALIENQKKVLADLSSEIEHFEQDATKFDLPGEQFDLIVANEVIADFPMASVERRLSEESDVNQKRKWQGEGVCYIEKYQLATDDAPNTFVVSAGAFKFVERCWQHLSPGGTLIVTEYGRPHIYPVQSVHLNHDEYSIHFSHLATCAAKVGFSWKLLTLKEFLAIDDEVRVLNGREEHILCLNHVLRQHGKFLPYAVISQSEFEKQFQEVSAAVKLTGFSFSTLSTGYHFGPRIADFMVMIMHKPA